MKRKEPKYKYYSVMLIDDNELDNFINEKILESSFFAQKIYTSTSGKSAIEFFNNMITMGDEFSKVYPQVIFVDLNMPMIDGFQFIEYFKKHNEPRLMHPRVVVLTSSVYNEDKQRAMDISEDIIFLNKPLTTEMLKTI